MIDRNELEKHVRSIVDFPKPGIIFRDVTTILQDPDAFRMAVDGLCELINDVDFDVIVGLEARGFIFGAAVAYKLGKAFVPVRKKGKLPFETYTESYDLEYGTAEIEIHTDAIEQGSRVIIIDDLLATGGTAGAAANLLKHFQAEIVKICFILELKGLCGRDYLKDYKVETLISYDGK